MYNFRPHDDTPSGRYSAYPPNSGGYLFSVDQIDRAIDLLTYAPLGCVLVDSRTGQRITHERARALGYKNIFKDV